jgi:hypothetical protein
VHRLISLCGRTFDRPKNEAATANDIGAHEMLFPVGIPGIPRSAVMAAERQSHGEHDVGFG